jgi:hypothetical protein
LDGDLSIAGADVRQLKEASKEVQGFGYTVHWIERASRTHGRNLFPQRIVFETQDDFLRYIGKQREFASFARSVEQIRSRYPELASWIRSHRKLLIDAADQVEGLLHVVDYLRQHSRPGLFAREIPIPVDTKFIERNRRMLRDWLDRLLPPHVIRADEEHFERRFGLRYAEPHILVRFLDPLLQQACGCPWRECSIPLHTLANTVIPADRVLIVENKVNLLTLPPLPGMLALGGLGNGVADLRYVPWLGQGDIWYWGDIDTDGFAILSRLRAVFPHTRSLLMDDATLRQWREALVTEGNGQPAALPVNLNEAERIAFTMCAEENLRIEQERFPHEFVLDQLQTTF